MVLDPPKRIEGPERAELVMDPTEEPGPHPLLERFDVFGWRHGRVLDAVVHGWLHWAGLTNLPIRQAIVKKNLAETSSRVYPMLMFFTGADIAAIRQKLGLTQKAFGEALGVAEATVSRWEADKRRPRFDDMERLNDLADKVGYRRGRAVAAAK